MAQAKSVHTILTRPTEFLDYKPHYITIIVYIRQGRKQCIFPRSQHTCLYKYILTKSEFISSCNRPAVRLNIVQITRATFFVNVSFYKMAAGSRFGCPKITSYHFRSIPQFLFLCMFYKMAPAVILDVQNSLSMALLAINTKLFFLKIFTKWSPAPILDIRNSLSIAFLAISDRYATYFFFWYQLVVPTSCTN